MHFFCRLLGHTWIHQTDNPKISWNTNAKTQAELELTAPDEPRFWLECVRCAKRIEESDPGRAAPRDVRCSGLEYRLQAVFSSRAGPA